MSFRVRPVGRAVTPKSTMFSVPIGEMTLTRFSYGIEVDLDSFDADAGKVLVLTTLRGATRHVTANAAEQEVTARQTYVTDCSRADYRLIADPDHLQLNLTIPHGLLADLALRWWGHVPDDRLWRHGCVVGGEGSPWLALLAYASRTAAAAPDAVSSGRIGEHLEEMIGAQLLEDWARRAQLDLESRPAVTAPRYVRLAAQYAHEHARELPTVLDLAQIAGVSARALSGAFGKYLNMTPRSYLIEQRLQGVYRDLSSGHTTVSATARNWGYVNLGVFASSYRRRFGELPSETLARRTA
ncbi:AraC family transcriptional regulator [Gordonia malaquae]|jgi:AraC-like DNA-binding protein